MAVLIFESENSHKMSRLEETHGVCQLFVQPVVYHHISRRQIAVNVAVFGQVLHPPGHICRDPKLETFVEWWA